MKIAILHGPQDLRIEERPLDTSQLKPQDIWVETRITAMKIGTDRGNYEGAEEVPGAPVFPRWVGDSNLGIVRKIGRNVRRFRVGDRVVACLPHQSEYIASEDGPVVAVPAGVADEDAVYGFLYALSALCFRKAHYQVGENVAVLGLGVLGMGATALGQAYGANVIGIGNSTLRLEMAQRMGARHTFLYNDPNLKAQLAAVTQECGVDLVIQTANPWPAYQTAVEIVRPGGRVSIVALPGRGEPPLDFNPLDMKWFYHKGISLIAVAGQSGEIYKGQDVRFDRNRSVAHVLQLMEDGRVEPKRLVTHRFHYTDIKQAYEMAFQRNKSMLGVIFRWD